MTPQRIELADGGQLEWWEHWLPAEQATSIYVRLRDELPWAHKNIRMFGRDVPQPRLMAWHGDPGTSYTYSGVTNEPQPWTPALTEVRERLRETTGVGFNSVLANLYRDERDSMGWHADREPELGPNPVIASVSLGTTRRFRMKHTKRGERIDFELSHGSLLLMRGTTQHHWKHAVPKERTPREPRINLTYRTILPR